MLVQGVEAQPVLPVLQRLRPDQRGELWDRGEMISVELLYIAELRRAEQSAPVDPRSLLLELLARPHLRSSGEVLALFARLVRLRDLGLEVDDPPCGALRIGIARVLQDLRDISLILRPRVGHLGVPGEVIVALRQ